MSRLALSSSSSSLSLAKTTLLHRSFILRLKPARMASSAAGDNSFIAEFPLSASSFLKINKGDIIKWFINGSSDAIVNPANERMLGGGGAYRAIHRAAGPELFEVCFKVHEVSSGIRCPTGEARITPGFKLPASHVIHTVGPIYDSDPNPGVSLKNAYKNSLIVARDNNIKYVAFPAVSCGVYGSSEDLVIRMTWTSEYLPYYCRPCNSYDLDF
ncbi:Macro domain-containing protein XCC3184 [Linum perenne]